MKLIYEFNEKEILEQVKGSGETYNLQRAIVDEIKSQAKNDFVRQIKEEIQDKWNWEPRDYFREEVKKEILEKVDGCIKKLLEDNLSEKTLAGKIDRMIDQKLDEWIEKKIYKRLEDIKADIQFYSTEERKLEEEDYARAEQAAYEQGREESVI